MKTSVIEVHDMLSVLGVDDLEKRISEVPGIESATVNFAAGNATVRYDETRITMADIKSAVRQRGYESGEAKGHDHEGHSGPGTPEAPAPAAPKPPSVAPAKEGAASASSAEKPKPAPSATAKPSPTAPPAHTAAMPKSPPGAADPAHGAHEGHEQDDKAASEKH